MRNLNEDTKKSSAGILVLTLLLLSMLTITTQAGWSNTADSPLAGCPTARAPIDFDGDNKTDVAVIRNTGSGQMTWYIGNSSGTPALTAVAWGVSGDYFLPMDFDGDNKTDVAVWRVGVPGVFYILQSQTNTLRAEVFGQQIDDPRVTDDYTGDGIIDLAVYRRNDSGSQPSVWYYRASSGPSAGSIVGVQWGQLGDTPAPGDYDGDGRNDFVVRRNAGGGAAVFHMNQTVAGTASFFWGTTTDRIVPGDYDGDCKTDIAVARASGGVWQWYSRRSSNGSLKADTFGAASDFLTQGDYDGDGITDVSVWRSGVFYWQSSGNGTSTGKAWGQGGDYPLANYSTY